MLRSPIASKTPPLKKAPPLMSANPPRYKTTKAMPTPYARPSSLAGDAIRVSRINSKLRRQITNEESSKASPLFKTKTSTPQPRTPFFERHENTHSRLSSPKSPSLQFSLFLKGAGVSLKKHSKEENEDAFFLVAKGAGVADGVGSWR